MDFDFYFFEERNGGLLGGLKQLGDRAATIGQILTARIDKPMVHGMPLWKTHLFSRTMQLYGGLNEDGRTRFKIDNEPDLETLLNQPVIQNGPLEINEQIYRQSRGIEFIAIPKDDLRGANSNYVIRADKYQNVREPLNRKELTVADLVKAGGFKVSVDIFETKAELTPEEVKTHDGWLEYAVGKNMASAQEYEQALRLLGQYIAQAQQNECFLSGTGMDFGIKLPETRYIAFPTVVVALFSKSGSRPMNIDFPSAALLKIN